MLAEVFLRVLEGRPVARISHADVDQLVPYFVHEASASERGQHSTSRHFPPSEDEHGHLRLILLMVTGRNSARHSLRRRAAVASHLDMFLTRVTGCQRP